MGFWSSVGSFVASAVSSVAGGIGRAYDAAKSMAGQAIGWMAEKAEGFVGAVKGIWATVKPFVQAAQEYIRMAAAATKGIPWLSGALLALDAGITALTAFEDSPIAKKVDAAIKWAIELAKRWHRSVDQQNEGLSEEELATAKRHQETLHMAEDESTSEAERRSLELASVINDYQIARTDVTKAIEGEPADFEHYLRLRATQKLLMLAERKFRSAETVDDLGADDVFLVRIASDLVKARPELSQKAAERLDKLLSRQFGTKLQPFIFEELIASWAKRAESLQQDWNAQTKLYATDSVLFKRLSIAQQVQSELSAEETAELARLQADVPARKQKLDELASQKLDIDRYVGAAEGFLQLLEKSPDQIEADDQRYLLEDGTNVGRILIDCAEHDRPFSELNEEDQELVRDYANIFKEQSETRMKRVLVEVAA